MNKKSIVKILLILSIVLCIMGILSPVIIRNNIVIEGLKLNEISGWIGDIMSPFFGLASVILLIVTIILQRDDMIAHQDELQSTREDLNKQIQMIELQRFEGTFFNLLSFHNDFISSMKSELICVNIKKEQNISGKKCLEYLYKEFQKNYEIKHIDYTFLDSSMMRDVEEEVREVVKLSYDKVYNKNEDYMSRYFTSLYHILKFIDISNSISYEEKKYYASLVRAHLTNYELALIFYNCNLEYGAEKFKPLVNKYDLMQNMNRIFLLHKSHEWIYKD